MRALRALDLTLDGRSLPGAATIGQRVALLRRRRGLSQRALCEILPCSQATLVALEHHQRGRLDVLERILTTLGAGPVLRSANEIPRFYQHAALSSVHHGWHTPPGILKILYDIFGTFDLDPCSPTRTGRGAPVRARVRFTLDDDGLSLRWFGAVYLNPPYGRDLPRWTAKAREQVAAGNAGPIIALLPARTDTKWWHRDIAGQAHVAFLRGRLKFGRGDQSTPFPSALVMWGVNSEQIAAVGAAFPDAWHLSARSVAHSPGSSSGVA